MTIWMDLQDIVLSEISQECFIFTYIWKLKVSKIKLENEESINQRLKKKRE